MKKGDTRTGSSLSRRQMLSAAALTPALAAPASARESSVRHPNHCGGDVERTESPVVETTGGKIAGYGRDQVNIFKGIPYADPPTGEYRFARPPPLTPWPGIRNCLNYGPVCPVVPEAPRDQAESPLRFMSMRGEPSEPMEDCLRLNIWAPAGGTGSRPVMVWLHAGGFRRGSSQEYLASDGENLARRQGVVVVSFNHRIGPLGFLNLMSENGSSEPGSANAGMHDIVVALKWVRENIANFGGDSANITLFGQSGGGFKISVLRAMPEAKGLFQRAIIQSGARLRVQEPEISARLARALLSALEIAPTADGLRNLRKRELSDILLAARVAKENLKKEPASVPSWAPDSWLFEPTADISSLPFHPGDPRALKSAPMSVICGSTRNEISPSIFDPSLEDLSWDDVIARLAPALGDKTHAAVDAARKDDRSRTPTDVYSILLSREFRLQAVEYCDRASRAGAAPVYNYVFDWHTPLFEGRPRAYHTSDVAFSFVNTDLVAQQTGGGPEPAQLGMEISARWANFARTGEPNLEGAAPWPAYDTENRMTMIFGARGRPESGSDAALLDVLQA